MRIRGYYIKGFTLVEILISIAIFSLILSVVVPFSYSLFFYYKDSREVEKLIIFLSSLRREAFLYNKEFIIYEKEGRLFVNENPVEKIQLKVSIEKPIHFYKNGTSSGGIIFVSSERNIFKIIIYYPFGEIFYEKA